MSELRLGGTLIDTAGQLKVGSSNVEAVYLGATQIFPGTTTTTTTVPPTTTTTTSTTTLAPTTTSTTTTTTTVVSFAFNISAPNTIGVGGTCDLPLNTEPQVYSTENSVTATLGDIIYQNPGLTTPFVGDPTKEYALEYTGDLGLIRIVQIDSLREVTAVANCY